MQEVLRALGGSRARKKIQIKFREQDNVERNFVFKDVPKEVIIPFQAARDLAEMQGFSVEKMNTEPRIPWEQIKEEDRGTPGNLTEIRPPIAVLLGHYNHGKTTLLDRFRGGNSKLVAEELCGITQEIRAVNIHDAKHRFKVTLIDTPGQDIFYGMRSRGVGIADFAILVVSAVDGICQQTEECIGWIQEWNIPTVVALNKMDIAPKKQIETLVAQLKEFECLDKSCIVPLSARTGDGLDDLRTAMQKLMGNLGVIKSSALENLEPHCTVLDVRKNEGVGHEFLLIVKTGIVRQSKHFFFSFNRFALLSSHI